MKTRILSLLFLLMFSQGFSQKNDLELQRNQLYQDYMNFKDTMSSRTWLNMVSLANKLEAVVLFDNVMLDSLKVISPGQANLEARIAELSEVKDELIINNTSVNEQLAKSEKARRSFLISSIILGILLIILMILFIAITLKYRKIATETEGYSADTLKLKHLHKEETDVLKDKIENYIGEIELMENNALEMKKSFDVMKSEHSNQPKNTQINKSDEFEEIRKELGELSDELTRVMSERDEFEESLGMSNLKLAHQIDLNKKFEVDLEGILGRIKGKPLKDQD